MEFLSAGTRAYLIVLTAILGLVMGSAMNCLAWRIANGKSWSGGRSICPACGHTLGILDLIPLLSWLFLKGRCRYCNKRISVRYPAVEGLMALIYVSALLRFDLTYELIPALVLGTCLVTLSLVDLDILEIPNVLVLVPAVLRLLYLGVFAPDTFLKFLLSGVCLGGGMLLFSLLMDRLLKKESMGGGDIKLFCAAGLFLTLPQCILLLVISSFLGILFGVMMHKKADGAFPFGPAIAAGTWITMLTGERLINWYIGLF